MPGQGNVFEQLKQTVETSIAGMSLVTKAVLVAVVLFHLLSRSDTIYKLLAVTPAAIGPPQFHIWTLITGGFTESRLLLAVADSAALAIAGGLFEPMWGKMEYAKFLVVVSVFSCLNSALTFIFVYALNPVADLNYLFFQYGGLWGALAGFLVAFKQLFPQRRFALGALGLAFECRLGPASFCGVLSLLYILGFLRVEAATMAIHGMLASWTYLRFYQEKDGGKGDGSESFSFADFFPAFIQPAVALFAGHVFNAAVACKLCAKAPIMYDLGSSSPSAIKTALPDSTPSDADRRRERALRDLEARTRTSDVAPIGVMVVPNTPRSGDGSNRESRTPPASGAASL